MEGDPHEMKITSAYLNIKKAYKNTSLPEISEKWEFGGWCACSGKEIEVFEYFNKGVWLFKVDHTLHNLQMQVQVNTDLLSYTAILIYLSEITVGDHQSRQIFNNFRGLPGYNKEKKKKGFSPPCWHTKCSGRLFVGFWLPR